jgi:ribose/xylose/arabinose/galactoside ABC-type transport system permease subunit
MQRNTANSALFILCAALCYHVLRRTISGFYKNTVGTEAQAAPAARLLLLFFLRASSLSLFQSHI